MLQQSTGLLEEAQMSISSHVDSSAKTAIVFQR